jgi:uncharacterized LabA/DUF88 family protein
MNKPLVNYAYIDGQNFYKSVQAIDLGDFNYRKFRIYLTRKHGISIAYYFLGYIPENEPLYLTLRQDGFQIIFKEVSRSQEKYKGNVDVNLTVRAMADIDQYQKAVIITSDGDYACLAEYLINKNKLECIIASSRGGCSYLLRKLHSRTRIFYMDDIIRDLKRYGPDT